MPLMHQPKLAGAQVVLGRGREGETGWGSMGREESQPMEEGGWHVAGRPHPNLRPQAAQLQFRLHGFLGSAPAK